jgi:ubiquitin-protein ligase
VFDSRHDRLLADQQALEALSATSTILTWQANGEPPDLYTLTFAGKGLTRDTAESAIRVADSHRCTMRLPFSYPAAAPDVQWLTPLVHPNVSFGGLVSLDDIGLPWSPQLGLDVVCDRLWDVLRLAYVNAQRTVNPAAAQHLRTADWNLPLDERPLRDCAARQVRNIVRYRRRSDAAVTQEGHRLKLAGDEPDEAREAQPSAGDGIMYISDEE